MKNLYYPKNFTQTELQEAIRINTDLKGLTEWLIRSIGELSQSWDEAGAAIDLTPVAWRHSLNAIVFEMERLELLNQEYTQFIHFLCLMTGEPEANHGATKQEN